MSTEDAVRVRVSMLVRATPRDVYRAFVEPALLAGFWLGSSSGPLALGIAVRWTFKVPGAEVDTTATRLDPGIGLSWGWSDGTTVEIDLQPVAGDTAVTVVHHGFKGRPDDIVAAALDATEGFALVLADLKTLLETGASANIVRDKARLIELRR
jgi:uncharacterized protein YndB with AHSA1/START domain